MKPKAINSVKEAFESDNVIITKIKQGFDKRILIDAKTRHRIPDKDNFISKWVSFDYANNLCIENKGYNLSEHKNFYY